MKLQTAERELNANFSIEKDAKSGADFSIVLEARGGGLNPDYIPVLRLLLLCIGRADARVQLIEVDSAQSRKLPPNKRVLDLRFPLKWVTDEASAEELRKEICAKQKSIAQTPGAKGGNPTKRIRIHVKGMKGKLSVAEFRSMLQSVDGPLRRRIFVLVWKPSKHSPWPERLRQIEQLRLGKRVRFTWSIGARKSGIADGDQVVLLQQGANRGIIGVGRVTGGRNCVVEASHHDPARKETGRFVKFDWLYLVDDENRYPTERLLRDVPEINWLSIQSSGTLIPVSQSEVVARFIGAHFDRVTSDDPVNEIERVIDVAAGRRRQGQGFGLDAQQRRAVERRAMLLAKQHLKSLGWKSVVDTSQGNPYDFLCTHPKRPDLYVEVKGTTGDGQFVLLTRNEVDIHKKKRPNNALIIVSNIKLVGPDRVVAKGGDLAIRQPWLINDRRLESLAFRYEVSD